MLVAAALQSSWLASWGECLPPPASVGGTGKGEGVENGCWVSHPVVSLGHQIASSIAWWLKTWHWELGKRRFESQLCSFLTVLSLEFPIYDKGVTVDLTEQAVLMVE